MNLLDIVLALPLIGFFVLLLIPRAAEGAIRAVALGFSLVAFAASLGLAFQYEAIRPGEQFVTDLFRHYVVDAFVCGALVLLFRTPPSLQRDAIHACHGQRPGLPIVCKHAGARPMTAIRAFTRSATSPVKVGTRSAAAMIALYSFSV